MKMNKNAEDHEWAVKMGIVESGVWRPLAVVEWSKLNERPQEERSISFELDSLKRETHISNREDKFA
jgi:tRNA A37 threonylcarbamoyladenosine biosynthesis protein TsaE